MMVRRYSVIGFLVVCIAAAGLLAYRYRVLWLPETEQESEAPHRRFSPKPAKARAHLYFSDADHRHLTSEVRPLALPDSVVLRARKIIDALIEGPEGPLTPTVPAGTKLMALHITQDGIAYLDFNRAISENHPGGTLSELLTIFSVVNTLAVNIPEIQAVKILIGGREAETLAGHIDIRFPFRPDMRMIQHPVSNTG